MDKLSNEGVGTVRTAVNAVWLTAAVALVAKITGWKVEMEDILPYVPILLPVAAGFYRLCRLLADKYPVIGTVLFGIAKKPVYVEGPAVVIEQGPPEVITTVTE